LRTCASKYARRNAIENTLNRLHARLHERGSAPARLSAGEGVRELVAMWAGHRTSDRDYG
jgi:hypothetical protein